MGQRKFRPQLKTKYVEPPVFDPGDYPPVADVDDKDFGALFSEVYRFANNLYDVVKTGPGPEKIAMEFITSLVTTFLIDTAAWVEGQTVAPPSPGILRAQLQDIKQQAFHYQYENKEAPAIAHLLSGAALWFIPRLYALHDRAEKLKTTFRHGTSTLRVTVEYAVTIEAAESCAVEQFTGMACREFFSGDNVRFVRVKNATVVTGDKHESGGERCEKRSKRAGADDAHASPRHRG